MWTPTPLHGPSGHPFAAYRACQLALAAGVVVVVLWLMQVLSGTACAAGIGLTLCGWAIWSTGGRRPRRGAARLALAASSIAGLLGVGGLAAEPALAPSLVRLALVCFELGLVSTVLHLNTLRRQQGWLEDRGGMHWAAALAGAMLLGVVGWIVHSMGLAPWSSLRMTIDIALIAGFIALLATVTLHLLRFQDFFHAPAPERPIPAWEAAVAESADPMHTRHRWTATGAETELERGGWRLRLRLATDRLPAQVEVAVGLQHVSTSAWLARRTDASPAVRLSDPILAQLVAVGGLEEEEANRRLDGLHEHLLPFLMEPPVAGLRDGWLICRTDVSAPGPSSDRAAQYAAALRELLPPALQLAAALDTPFTARQLVEQTTTERSEDTSTDPPATQARPRREVEGG